MNEIILKKVSYGQLREREWLTDKDRYGLASFVDDNVRKTFLHSPNNNNDEKTAVLLAVDNGDVVGRHLLYGTSIKQGDNIIKAQSSGSTEVHESQRGKGIGSKINRWTLENNEYPVYICSLLSPACLRIMSKQEYGCTIFDFPQFVKIVNTEAAFGCRGIKGGLLSFCKTLGNAALWLRNIPIRPKMSKLKKQYKLVQEKQVPEWAGEMCLNDGHKYAEYHDNNWLEWNLTHTLSGRPEDQQYFYSIYNKENKIVGFFMTKVRVRRDIEKYNKMIIGTLCEWASVSSDLKESDINLLATTTFPKNCYQILTITDNPTAEKELRRIGFIKRGSMQMGFRDKLNQFPDMANQSLWRIRYGCCNSILY
jgi:hypothetical protein